MAELRSKITFLINKIENEDERSSKPSLGNVSFIGAELVKCINPIQVLIHLG